LLKPNASAIVAQLYPEGGARLDAGFTIYYVGINVGATIGPLITGWLSVRYGWSYGFMAAALGMSIGVLQYQWRRPLLGLAGRAASARAVAGNSGHAARVRWGWRGALALLALGALMLLLWNGRLRISAPALRAISTQAVLAIAVLYFAYLLFAAGLERAERRRVQVVVVLFIASVMFWAGFEQAGSSLNLFAERHTARALLGLAVPSSWLQALGPIFIVVFGPLFSALWLWLARRNLDPSTPSKFILGLLGMGLGFLVMAAAAREVVSGQLAGMGWLTVTYLLHTWGELCLSPVGLSAVSKLVPRRFVGQSLGVWFVSISLGDLIGGGIAGNIGAAAPSAMSELFMRIFWFAALCASGLAVCAPLLRRWAGGVK
jgi:POT family proton-dependent oligopeptide transporter